MKISYNWLLDYIPFKLNKDELSLVLTSIGLEVESVTYFEKYIGGLDGLVVGKIIEINQHPESDKLKVTRVYISETVSLQIICGANNIEVGQNVAIAMNGTTIYPTNGNAQKIQAILIKGVDSLGMICSGYEIGINNDKSGVLILNPSIKPGTLLKDIFIQYTDWIFEIGLTANRMDANYHYGVARDLYAYFLHHNNEYKLKQIYNIKLQTYIEKCPISIQIENKKDCARYVGIYIKDVQVKESPTWLQNCILSIGLKPINNIVDITNFILHETGQPLHAFDATKIVGNKIIVKNFPTNTKFTTLDGVERSLFSTDLMISDTQKPLCMAGVYGGLDAGITEHTTAVFLESAFFNPIAIRKSATMHNLRTDASSHFEKGIDISNCKNALIRAAQFIQEMAGGNLSIVEDIYPNPIPPTTINLSYSFIKKLSGNNFHPQKIKDLLKSLQFDILIDKTDLLQVGVPFSKIDIKNQADLVEEIIRIDGINNIPIQKSIKIISQVEQENYGEKIIEKIETFLVGNGFSEIITNSLTNSKYYDDYQLDICVKLLNSVSTELNILRPSLLETGLEVVSYNLNRQQLNLKLFEVGKVYSTFEQNYIEKTNIGIFITGNKNIKSWNNEEKQVDIYTAKGMVESIFQLLKIDNTSWVVVDDLQCIHILKNNQVIAEIFKVEENILKKFTIKQPVFFICLQLNELVQLYKNHQIVYKELDKFPQVERDLSIIVSKDIKYENVQKIIYALQISILQNYYLFDMFENDKIGKDKKSLGCRFVFKSNEKTLQDYEVDTYMQQIQDACITHFEAIVRK